MTKVDARVEQLSDLDRFLGQQPKRVREAADDATEFFQLIHAMRGLRRHRGLTQSSVAEDMGTTQSAVSELESLRTDPQVGTLLRYVRAVGGRLHLRAAVEDAVRVEGPVKWRNATTVDSAPLRIRARHLKIADPGISDWRTSA